MGHERDVARREFEGLVSRLAERPTTVLMKELPASPAISPEPAYFSDLPYHDEQWDEFATANESTEPEEDD